MNGANQSNGVELPAAGVFDPLAVEASAETVFRVKKAQRPTPRGVRASADPQEIKRLVVRPLFDLIRPKPGDRSELLKNRFLCRGGGALLVGQTGQGKSSLAMQAALSWAAGLPLFGIVPNGPLRVLIIQGENDDGDLAEARDGVAWAIEGGFQFSNEGEAEKVRELLRENVFVVSENSLAGAALFESLALLLEQIRPDLILIDPAFSYVEGDASNSADVGRFLRQGLNPLLSAHDCGAVVIHHTAKPPGQKGALDRSSSAYAGHGSAEWANWARAVLTIEGIGGGCYKLHAAKRGGRLGWRDGEDKPAFFKVLEHSTNEAGFCWVEVSCTAAETAGKDRGKPGLAELMELVPASTPITKDALIELGRAFNFGTNRARILIGAAVGEGKLFEWRVKVPGRTRALVKIARVPQPEGGKENEAPTASDNVHG